MSIMQFILKNLVIDYYHGYVYVTEYDYYFSENYTEMFEVISKDYFFIEIFNNKCIIVMI